MAMSTITTTAERAALPAGTVVLSAGGTIACRHVDLDGVLFGIDASFRWDALQLPLTVLYRPDVEKCVRTEPTEEQAAEAACRATHPTRWEHAILRHPCDNCTAGARAVLALLPQRCAPSEEEIAQRIDSVVMTRREVMQRGDGEWLVDDLPHALARGVADMLGAQPTVREAKAEAWRQGYSAACDKYGNELGTYGDKIPDSPYRSEADHG